MNKTIMTRLDFLRGFGAAATLAAAPGTLVAAVPRPRLDPNLTLLFSDSHVNGHQEAYPQYESKSLADVVKRVLALDPLPARAIHFGDLAYLWGHKEDYAHARDLLKPLVDAGIKLTIGMGNHDRRSAFLESFPEYAETTKIPGRIVSVVDAGAVDFIMLDGLMGADDRGPKDMGPGGGALCRAQQDWLAAELPKWRKPVFVCSHWPVGGLRIGNGKMHKFLIRQPMVAGYIHGHDHRWRKDVEWESWSSPRLLKTLCLPSTGHWGDIGFALLRTEGSLAKVALRQHDFYFPCPDPHEPGENRALRRFNVEENRGLSCSFTLPRA